MKVVTILAKYVMREHWMANPRLICKNREKRRLVKQIVILKNHIEIYITGLAVAFTR